MYYLGYILLNDMIWHKTTRPIDASMKIKMWNRISFTSQLADPIFQEGRESYYKIFKRRVSFKHQSLKINQNWIIVYIILILYYTTYIYITTTTLCNIRKTRRNPEYVQK